MKQLFHLRPFDAVSMKWNGGRTAAVRYSGVDILSAKLISRRMRMFLQSESLALY